MGTGSLKSPTCLSGCAPAGPPCPAGHPAPHPTASGSPGISKGPRGWLRQAPATGAETTQCRPALGLGGWAAPLEGTGRQAFSGKGHSDPLGAADPRPLSRFTAVGIRGSWFGVQPPGQATMGGAGAAWGRSPSRGQVLGFI